MRSSLRERRLLAAVQEVGDVRVFLGFRHAELGLAGRRHHAAQDVFQLVGREQHAEERRQRLGIERHAERGRKLDDALTGEAVELRIEQGGEDFPDPVGAEVEAEDAVAVLHPLVVADHRGRDELVVFLGLVGGVHGLHRVFRAGARLRRVRRRLCDAVPAVVAIHGEVAADDSGDADAAGQRGAQPGDVVGAGLRRGVAAVGEGVHDGGDAGVVQDLRQGDGVVLVRVHAAGRHQAHQVAGALGLAEFADEVSERRGLGDAAVGNGVADAHQFLMHHAAGADIHVADLGVAHLPLGQADIAAGGVQEGVRARLPQLGEGGGPGEADGVVLGRFPPAEAIEDHQHYRTNRLRHGSGPCLWLLELASVLGRNKGGAATDEQPREAARACCQPAARSDGRSVGWIVKVRSGTIESIGAGHSSLCHGRPTGRAEGPPEDRLRPATRDFAAGSERRRGWQGQARP